MSNVRPGDEHADMLATLARLDERSAALHDDISEIKEDCRATRERLDETRDIAVEAAASAKRNGALSGGIASGGLLGLVEVMRGLFGSG